MWRADGAKVTTLTRGGLEDNLPEVSRSHSTSLLAGRGRRIVRRKVKMFENIQRKQKISFENYLGKVVVQP